MNFKIGDVFRSAISEFSCAIIECCLVTSNIELAANHAYTNVFFASLSIAGIVLLGLIIWFFKNYIGDIKVKTMPRKPYIVVSIISFIIFVIWALTTDNKICHSITVIISWCLLAIAIIYYVVYSYGHKSESSNVQ